MAQFVIHATGYFTTYKCQFSENTHELAYLRWQKTTYPIGIVTNDDVNFRSEEMFPAPRSILALPVDGNPKTAVQYRFSRF